MKPLDSINLNKHAIITSADRSGHKKVKRPALELLNQLNDRIMEENSVMQYRKEIDRLKEENLELKVINGEISK